MDLPTEEKRRRTRAAHAVTGTRGKKEVGTAKTRAADPVRVSTDRRFSMRDHTVKIVNPRPEWKELKGSYGRVENYWGDGSVCLSVTRPGRDGTSRIAFSREEVEIVPMGDTLRHCNTEEYRLIVRSVALGLMPKYGGPDRQPLSDALKAAVMKRVERLNAQIKAIQRIRKHDLPMQASGMALGLSNWCTALVPYTGGQE